MTACIPHLAPPQPLFCTVAFHTSIKPKHVCFFLPFDTCALACSRNCWTLTHEAAFSLSPDIANRRRIFNVRMYAYTCTYTRLYWVLLYVLYSASTMGTYLEGPYCRPSIVVLQCHSCLRHAVANEHVTFKSLYSGRSSWNFLPFWRQEAIVSLSRDVAERWRRCHCYYHF